MNSPFRFARLVPMLCCVVSLSAPKQVIAKNVVITITGTLASGLDISGTFGPPNSSLAQKMFTLVFTVDPSKGTPDTELCSNGLPYYTAIISTNTSNPATATLSLNGHSFTFGVLNAAYAAYSTVSRQYAHYPNCNADSLITLTAGDGYYGDGSGLSGNIRPATGTILTSDPNWPDSFTDDNLFPSSIGFEISEFGTTGDNVSGLLTPMTVTVRVPM